MGVGSRWCAAAVLFLLPEAVLAWGAPGHEIVASMAERRLSPAARAMVRELVGGERLSEPSIATWADAQRDRQTRPWHYVNVPSGSSRYIAARDCARGCVVEALRRMEAELQGEGPPLRRADALRWVVHLVADAHQPLHAGDPLDRGGNELLVRVGRRRQPVTFHSVWDTEVVRPLLKRRGVDGAAAALAASTPPALAVQWERELDPVVWVEESSATARAIYAELGRRPGESGMVLLSSGYAAGEEARTATALAKAGVRLAAVLNRIAEGRSHGR